MRRKDNHFNNKQGLYDPAYEHDACGVGMIVNIHGEKSHEIVEAALKVLENMRHRGAEGADNKTGDGAGILLQIPHEFILLQGIPVPEKGKYGTGLIFLPKDEEQQSCIFSILIEEIRIELNALTQGARQLSYLGKRRPSDRAGHQADIYHRPQRPTRAGAEAIYNT